MKSPGVLFVVVVSIALCAAQPTAFTPSQDARRTSGKLLPVDEARRDPALRQLRERLLAAARRQDLFLLLPLLAEPVKCELDDLTRDQFIERFYRWSEPERTLFWQQLRDALTLGMAYDRDFDEPTLIAPYTTVYLPLEEVTAITGRGVAVHRAPDAASPILDRLDYDVVEDGPAGPEPTQPGEFGGHYEWRQIKTPKGQLGWVVSKYARGAVEPRFYFRQIGGTWKVIGYATEE